MAFASAFRKTVAAQYGPSGLTVTVMNVTDALSGKALYTEVRPLLTRLGAASR